MSLQGFQTASSNVTITSGSSPVLHVQLEVGTLTQTVEVSANPSAEAGRTVTPTTASSTARALTTRRATPSSMSRPACS
ncbi:MAG TPA: hypothetical protein VLT86_18225 [Vicinamibacterales bacterium]|nr:hypothetical protein [Vicinamibacterales bacterium]